MKKYFLPMLFLGALSFAFVVAISNNFHGTGQAASEQDVSAFVVFNVTVENPEKFREYLSQVPETLTPFGGLPLTQGMFSGVVSGDHPDHQIGAVATFPDVQSVDDWYNSDAYQALIPLREESANVVIIKYAVPQAASR